MNDMRSGKEFWNEAARQVMRDDPSFCDFRETPYMGRESDGSYTMEVQHEARCDELSRQIAIETGQAKEIAPGVIRYAIPDGFQSPFGKSEVLGKDLWKEGHFTLSPNSDTPVWHSSAAFDGLQEAIGIDKRDKAIMRQAMSDTPFIDSGSAIHLYLNRGGSDKGLPEMEKMYTEALEGEVERQEFGPNGYRAENTTNEKEKQMDNSFLRAGYEAQQLRIDQLEAYVAEVISKPSMSREMRMEGLSMVEDRSPMARQAVERICPPRGLEQGLELAIER
jgi:hypothetical protein